MLLWYSQIQIQIANNMCRKEDIGNVPFVSNYNAFKYETWFSAYSLNSRKLLFLFFLGWIMVILKH